MNGRDNVRELFTKFFFVNRETIKLSEWGTETYFLSKQLYEGSLFPHLYGIVSTFVQNLYMKVCSTNKKEVVVGN